MVEKDIQFDFRNVPKTWQVCFLSECPVKEQCLRQLAASNLPADRDWGAAVYPTMRCNEKGCRLFATGEAKRMAWGFNTLFSEVKAKHENVLRLAMKNYLHGHAAYYRYNRGEKLLSPEQQDWIVQLFQSMGYHDGLEFDHYVYAYDFDH
jgi:hypothetical protein